MIDLDRSLMYVNRLYLGTTRMADRVLHPEDSADRFGQEADAFLFAIAARDLRRGAEFLAYADNRLASRVESAVVDFDDAAPGLKDFRDITEHMDDYLLGIGNLQEAARGFSGRKRQVRLKDPTLDATVLMFWMRTENSYVLHMIVHPGNQRHQLDVGRVLEACHVLHAALEEAAAALSD